jgi:WS/DGAT/MGAT family acyltransferase
MPDPSYHRLTMLDNSFLAMEGSSTHMHVASAILFDAGPVTRPEGGIDADRILEYVRSRLHLIPRYRQRLARIPVEGHPVWVDDDHFNIHYHVRHTSLPYPGSERQLKRMAARIMSQQLDRAKPLWEMWVVEGLDHGKRFALIGKTHHCMIDGISGADLISVLLQLSPEKDFDEAAAWTPRPAPGRLELLRDAITRRVVAPFSILRACRTPALAGGALAGIRENVAALGETLSAQWRPAPRTPLNRPIGPHRRFDWLAMDIADLKEVKDRLGGSLNDVVLATVAGALGRFLARRGVDVDRLEVRAFVPVSVRSASERGRLGNRVAAWMVPLPIAERDPWKRLARVSETTARLKRSRQALGAEFLSAVSERSGSTLLSLALQLASRSPFNSS